MKIAVFGLGNFGRHLAIKLTQMGHEVIAIDHDMDKVEGIKSEVSFSVCLESNDPQAVSTLPLGELDAAVVAIGENEGANIMTTALLVNLKVKRVISRAINPLHEMVLNSMGISEIAHPEEDAAERLARKLNLRRMVDQFELPGGFVISEIVVPDQYAGKPIGAIKALAERRLALVTVLRKESERHFLGRRSIKLGALGVMDPEFVPEKGDILVLFGTKDEVARFVGDSD
ncbi:MAG: TrkA family potassium uptake protein [Flavobacteriales bacterium]|nr:TrkA family potassium uptake protein [Flavobacteriales bacterium]MCB9167477.1 TrkA family potassium uptake protein [Flavobacteriales bacterium]MCB9171225.1 TrkA family potassium uptake protein [Flavobacteriales bacterium]